MTLLLFAPWGIYQETLGKGWKIPNFQVTKPSNKKTRSFRYFSYDCLLLKIVFFRLQPSVFPRCYRLLRCPLLMKHHWKNGWVTIIYHHFTTATFKKQKAKGTCCCQPSSTATAKTLPKMATKIQVSMNQKQRKNPSILSCHHLVWLNCWDSRFLVCTQRSMDFVFHTSRKNRPVLSASNWWFLFFA